VPAVQEAVSFSIGFEGVIAGPLFGDLLLCERRELHIGCDRSQGRADIAKPRPAESISLTQPIDETLRPSPSDCGPVTVARRRDPALPTL